MTEAERAAKRHAILTELSRKLTDSGKLIEVGWVGLQLACIPADAPPAQLEEMRMAFFAGAQHLFSSILTILEPGAEITDADLARMGQISAELDAFGEDFAKRHGIPQRRADG